MSSEDRYNTLEVIEGCSALWSFLLFNHDSGGGASCMLNSIQVEVLFFFSTSKNSKGLIGLGVKAKQSVKDVFHLSSVALALNVNNW